MRKNSVWLRLFVLLNVMATVGYLGSFTDRAIASGAKVGQTCAKINDKSGALVCLKLNGKLVWMASPKSQIISVRGPVSVPLASEKAPIIFSASSKLGVSAFSTTNQVCRVNDGTVFLLHVGNCILKLTQSGNSKYSAAPVKEFHFWVVGGNVISFSPPQSVNLASGTLEISAVASSMLPVVFQSMTPGICTLSNNILALVARGICQVRASQSGSDLYEPAQSVDVSINIKGRNQLSFSTLFSLLLSQKTYALVGTASSSLPVFFVSITPDTCSVNGTTLSLLKVGVCTVSASQSGSELDEPAQSVEVSLTIQGSNVLTISVTTSLSLSQKTYALVGTASSSLPVLFLSITPDICSVNGTTLTLLKIGICTVRASQSGSDLYEPAQSVDSTIQISGSRVTADQPDTISGFQLKFIYVVPSDGTDHNYDTNGYISDILSEGDTYLSSQMGLTVPIDLIDQRYDIQFFKSTLTTAYMTSALDLNAKLLDESKFLENPGTNRKNYIFLVDVPALRNDMACGYAKISNIYSVVAIGVSGNLAISCSGRERNFANYVTKAWIHELFHSFGVGHSLNDPCDLMAGEGTSGTCANGRNIEIDMTRNHYVGGESQGVNLLKLRVWKGYTDRLDLRADCVLNPTPRADGFNYAYCPTGAQTIGALKYCYGSINSLSLEEFLNGSWISLGAGNHYSDPWGANVSWKCDAGYTAPWKQLTVTAPGISLYRWIINGVEREQFKVIWVR